MELNGLLKLVPTGALREMMARIPMAGEFSVVVDVQGKKLRITLSRPDELSNPTVTLESIEAAPPTKAQEGR